MEKALSYDAIFAALAVLALGATTGCSKREPAQAEPASQPAANAPPPGAASAQAAAPTAQPTETNADRPAVDAGKDSPSHNKKAPQAACGATGCSPDMKKK